MLNNLKQFPLKVILAMLNKLKQIPLKVILAMLILLGLLLFIAAVSPGGALAITITAASIWSLTTLLNYFFLDN